MKYSKRYIAFTIVLALVFILKFQILGVDNAQVGRFRGGELDTQVWNPMVAKEVNGQTIHAVIDCLPGRIVSFGKFCTPQRIFQ